MLDSSVPVLVYPYSCLSVETAFTITNPKQASCLIYLTGYQSISFSRVLRVPVVGSLINIVLRVKKHPKFSLLQFIGNPPVTRR